jgi:hypothetical protein
MIPYSGPLEEILTQNTIPSVKYRISVDATEGLVGRLLGTSSFRVPDSDEVFLL